MPLKKLDPLTLPAMAGVIGSGVSQSSAACVPNYTTGVTIVQIGSPILMTSAGANQPLALRGRKAREPICTAAPTGLNDGEVRHDR